MQFKCFVCGETFEDIQQLAAHKKRHQAESAPEKKGLICLGCGKSIPLPPSMADYSGPVECPHCHRTMKVTLSGGEVVVARLG